MIYNVVMSLSMIQPTPRRRNWKLIPPPPLNLEIIEEEQGLSEYDCGYLDLGTGTETPTPHPIWLRFEDVHPTGLCLRLSIIRGDVIDTRSRLRDLVRRCIRFLNLITEYWTLMRTALNMLFYHVGPCAVERFFAPNI
jgi:hypothetical protein